MWARYTAGMSTKRNMLPADAQPVRSIDGCSPGDACVAFNVLYLGVIEYRGTGIDLLSVGACEIQRWAWAPYAVRAFFGANTLDDQSWFGDTAEEALRGLSHGIHNYFGLHVEPASLVWLPHDTRTATWDARDYLNLFSIDAKRRVVKTGKAFRVMEPDYPHSILNALQAV